MGKIVNDVKVLNWMNEPVKTKGVITSDGKFVVGAVARFNSVPQWKDKVNTTTGKVSSSRFTMRTDISISHWDGKNQGNYLFPYVSGRVIEIKSSTINRTFIATPFDNGNDRKPYKNLLIDNSIFEAINEAIGLAIDDAIVKREKGETTITIAGNRYISDPSKLSKLADDFALEATTSFDKTSISSSQVKNAEAVQAVLEQ